MSLRVHKSQLEMAGVLSRRHNRVSYHAMAKTPELDATTFMDTNQSPATQIKFIRELKIKLECSPLEYVETLQRCKSDDTASFEDEFKDLLILIEGYYGIKKTNLLLPIIPR